MYMDDARTSSTEIKLTVSKMQHLSQTNRTEDLLLLCCFTLAMVMSGWSVSLTTLFLGRLRPLKRLTNTSCTYLRQ